MDKYLYVDNDNFGFKVEGVNEILETDIKISDEIYNKFFEEQAKGKQFKIRNINGATFEEIFQEIIEEMPDVVEIEPSPLEKLQTENIELSKEMHKMKENIRQSIAELTMMIIPQ